MGTLSDVLKAPISTKTPQTMPSLVKSDDETSREPIAQSKRAPPHRPTVFDDDDEVEDDLSDLDGRNSRSKIKLCTHRAARQCSLQIPSIFSR